MHFRLLSSHISLSLILQLFGLSLITVIFASPVVNSSENPTVDAQANDYHDRNHPSTLVRSLASKISATLSIRSACLTCRRNDPSSPAPPKKNVDPARPNGPLVIVKKTTFCQPDTAGEFLPSTHYLYLIRPDPKPKMNVFWNSANAKHFLAKPGQIKALPHKEDDPTSRFYFCNVKTDGKPIAPLASEYKAADLVITEACGPLRGGGVVFGPASSESLGSGVGASSTRPEAIYARWANFADVEKAGQFVCNYTAMLNKFPIKSSQKPTEVIAL